MFTPAPYRPHVLVKHTDKVERALNVSVFDLELSLNELLHPSRFHLCHHVPHFSILLVQVSSVLLAMSALELVINSKFVHTNRNVFIIFHGRHQPLQELIADSRLDDVSFKHPKSTLQQSTNKLECVKNQKFHVLNSVLSWRVVRLLV